MVGLKKMTKFKVTAKKPDLRKSPVHLEAQASSTCGQQINKKVGFIRIKTCGPRVTDNNDRPIVVNAKPKSSMSGHKRRSEWDFELQGRKRSKMDLSEWDFELQGRKRSKMDRYMMRKCSSILKGLMTHPNGWIFNNPVDPVALGIPDYFSIISDPMDFGTIKSKLDKDEYSSVDDFIDDVRLTFSNCMRYNPPGNWFHIQAVKLQNLFDDQLKSMDTMRKNPIRVEKEKEKEKKNPIRAEKEKEGRGLATPAHSPILPAKRQIINSYADKRVGKCVVKKNESSITQRTSSTPRVPSSNVDTLPKASSLIIRKANPTCSMKRRCESKEQPVVAAICHSTPETNKSDTISCAVDRLICDGHTSSEEVSCSVSTLSAPSAPSFKDFTHPADDIQLSPKRGIRTAMLKCRFADIIIKAEQKTLLLPGNDVDSVKMRQEKERLARKISEEKARYEAEIMASVQKEEQERRLQRQQARDAARMALEKIQKSVDWDDNLMIVKDIQPLIRCTRRPLEKLGLFLKPEYMYGDVDDDALL